MADNDDPKTTSQIQRIVNDQITAQARVCTGLFDNLNQTVKAMNGDISAVAEAFKELKATVDQMRLEMAALQSRLATKQDTSERAWRVAAQIITLLVAAGSLVVAMLALR